MQISVETTSDIGRKISIRIPEEKIQEEVNSRLKSLGRRVKVDGFRPGKIPTRIMRQRFGKQIREEVIQEMVGSSFSNAVKEQDLKLAGKPEITPLEKAEGKGFSYEAQFEIYPEIDLEALKELEISQPVCEVTNGDLSLIIERLREQKKTWHEVDRPAQSGDRVIFSFEAFLNNEPIGKGKTERLEVVLGSETMIPGFESQLVGSKAGDHLEFELAFPTDYDDQKHAGQIALFKVDVEKVEEAQLPEINADFVKGYGVTSGDVEEFRREVRANIEHQAKTALKEQIRTRLLDAIYKHYSISLPKALVEQEAQHLMASVSEALKKKNPELLNQLPIESIQENAKKRVMLALLLTEIIHIKGLKPDPERVRQTLDTLAKNYEEPQKVIDWYSANPEQLSQIERQVLEEQAMEWVLEQAKVTEEPVSFDELMKTQQPQAA